MPATPRTRLRLGRSLRLTQGRDFRRTRAEGMRMPWGCMLANWNPAPRLRLGVIASRQIGDAVVRNRSRRLLKEVFRRHQYELAGAVDLVLVARASIVGKSYAAVERDFLAGLRRARLLRAPAPASPQA
jgi:ribonuclease P protein component